MSKTTRFRLNLPHIDIELSGERNFVEDLYQRVSKDLLPIYQQNVDKKEASKAKSKAVDKGAPHELYTWIYACTDLFHKVYVVENHLVETSIIGKWINSSRVRRLYLDQEDERIISAVSGDNKTLWAEFTDAGRDFLRKSD